MEYLLSELNDAYGSHKAAWAALDDTIRNGTEPSDEIVEQIVTNEERQLVCLRELLPPGTAVFVRTGSIYSAPDSVYPDRTVDNQVITIREVLMQPSPQCQYKSIVRSPFASTSSETPEGIWLQRSPEYYILGSGLQIAFSGLKYGINKLSSIQHSRITNLCTDIG